MSGTKAVTVMGAVRTGTSLTINILRKLGFYVEDDYRGRDESNEQGYGESKRLHDINDKILSIFRGTDDPIFDPLLVPGWYRDPRLAQILDEAKQLVSDMNTHDLWAWKVPSLSLTFPFWEPLLPNDHCCLICVRNPISSIKSASADGPAENTASVKWLLRNLAAIQNSRNQRRFFVFYEDYFDPKLRQAERIAEFVGRGGRVANLVSPELKHFDFTLDDVMQSSELQIDVKLLYSLLLLIRKDPEILSFLSRLVIGGGKENEESLQTKRILSQLNYYKAICDHPYVRFGLRARNTLYRFKKIFN